VRVVAISDTHNQHEQIVLPEGDLLVHAGDFSLNGEFQETLEFLDWFQAQSVKFRHGGVLISGNHDFMDQNHPDLFKSLLASRPAIKYLNNSGCVIDGKRIWGSPTTPYFCGWAFMPETWVREKHWEQIPEDCDLLITHGPAYMLLDLVHYNGKRAGCTHLGRHIIEKRVKNHVFGHIHSSYGELRFLDCRYFNVACLDEQYHVMNKPAEFEI
jgi:predicted phosphohydrolase